MADFSAPAPLAWGIARVALAPFRALDRMAGTVAGARAAADEIERLSSLSDAALSDRGLKREEIVERAVARHLSL